MKEKLRIDKEFRSLRQKYEVKSLASSSMGTNSLAFSKSGNTFKNSNQKTEQPMKEEVKSFFNPNRLSKRGSQDSNTHNHNQFYRLSDEGMRQFSVFKSPSIENESQSAIKEDRVFEYKPTKLF